MASLRCVYGDSTEQVIIVISADNYNYFQFNLKWNGRSENWPIYLYGDKSVAVKRQGVEVLSRGVAPPGIGDVGFDFSPIWTRRTPSVSCVCRVNVALTWK